MQASFLLRVKMAHCEHSSKRNGHPVTLCYAAVVVSQLIPDWILRFFSTTRWHAAVELMRLVLIEVGHQLTTCIVLGFGQDPAPWRPVLTRISGFGIAS